MADIGSGLSWFLIEDHELRVDEAEGINDDLPFNTLNGVDHYGHRTLIQLLKTLCNDMGRTITTNNTTTTTTTTSIWMTNR